jgi:hypothetical protein
MSNVDCCKLQIAATSPMPPALLRSLKQLALAAACLAMVSVLRPHGCAAQDSSFVEFEAWGDLATVYNFSPEFRYDGDYGVRGFFEAGFLQFYLRPSARYRPVSWFSLHGGLGWFHTFVDRETDVDELRPWMGIRAVWPRVGGFTFSHYLRMEWRRFYITADGDSFSRWRARYQLAARSPEFRIGNAQRFYVLGSIEPFKDIDATADDLLVNRVRIAFALGKTVSRALRTELNYLFHTSRLSQLYDFEVQEHIIRLRFFCSFN